VGINLIPEPRNALLKKTMLESMRELMKINEQVIWMDSDLSGAMGMQPLYLEYPERTINCGIMEANMVGVACGLSVAGKIPFAHTFGVFLARRALDQIFMSGSYNQANVKLIGSDPGVAAEHNGGTHMPFEDIGIMRTIPGMTVLDCADPVMLKSLIMQMADTYGMMYIRLPRNDCVAIYEENSVFNIEKGNLLKEGSDVTIFACGIEVSEALEAGRILAEEGISARVVDMFTIKPLDKDMVINCARETGAIVTCENANYINGLGSAVAEVLCETVSCPLERVGVHDLFGEVGDRAYLMKRFCLTSDDIVISCKKVIARKRI